MIESDEQYRRALQQLAELEQRSADMLASPGLHGLIHPLLREVEEGDLRDRLDELRAAIAEYESKLRAD